MHGKSGMLQLDNSESLEFAGTENMMMMMQYLVCYTNPVDKL